MHEKTVGRVGRAIGCGLVLLLGGPAWSDGGWVNVQEYFPENWEEDQSDVREYIQEAVDTHAKVYFPGGNDPDDPVKYHVSPTVEIPAHTRVKGGPNHRVVRIPGEGRLFSMHDHARMKGLVINGNKYEHWPEYPELGKEGEAAVHFRSHNVIEDTVVYDNPGHGFSSRGDYNKLYRNRAENIGYIDVAEGQRHYASRWDRLSGDGFYLRGEGNLIKDCEAYDAQRWDFCSSHRGARQNTYVDCRGGDINFRTYGFIDIEQAEDNNRLIRCISPNSRIAIPVSARTEVIQCMASHITVWDRAESIERYEDLEYENISNHGVLLMGNITTPRHGRWGGIAIGGYSTDREETTPGAASPIIVNNRIYKGSEAPGHRVDWSFSVYSLDGHGVVADNILFEYENEDEGVRGPGMNLENVEGHNNQVVYGQWELDLPRPELKYGEVQNVDELEGLAPH